MDAAQVKRRCDIFLLFVQLNVVRKQMVDLLVLVVQFIKFKVLVDVLIVDNVIDCLHSYFLKPLDPSLLNHLNFINSFWLLFFGDVLFLLDLSHGSSVKLGRFLLFEFGLRDQVLEILIPFMLSFFV